MPFVISYRFTGLPLPEKQGLYDPQFEHSACGVGLVANIDGTRSHEIIRQGLEVLINLGHRGAEGADPETGDGAGLMLQLPHEFFKAEAAALGFSLPDEGVYGVANVFLPMDSGVRDACETAIEGVVAREGLSFLGWRDVPTDPTAIGVLAARMQPFMRQFFVALDAPLPPGYSFELKLFVLRRQIESAVPAMGLKEADEFYVCSLSSNRVVYKGLVKAEQLEDFYHDLSEPSLKSAFAMVHSRFSTNTLGTWRLAHPYRLVIHNGEINTLRGNINWMMTREPRLSSPILGDDIEKLRPVVSAGQSDTSTLDNVLELLLATGRSLPHAMMMLIPEAWADHIPMDQAKKDFYEYHSALMEPWDGPALVIGTDGKKVCGILDRNGL